jgi:hypothetical protein
MKETGGAVRLSAHTRLPNGAANFTIYKVSGEVPRPPPNSSMGIDRPNVGTEIDRIEGEIEDGVCHAKWILPDGYDPFDFESWIIDPDMDIENSTDNSFQEYEEDELSSGLEFDVPPDRMKPPLFCIDVGEKWGFSGPPGVKLNRLKFINDTDARGIAIRNDGKLISFKATSGKVNVDDSIEIISLLIYGKNIESEAEE